jgi:DNA-binding NarL/FixJ family response regulator
LVEDNPDMVEAIRRALPQEHQLAGVYHDGLSALRDGLGTKPDLFILDVSLPDMNGYEVARALRARQPDARIIFCTVHMEQEYITAAFEVGASGYVFKSRLTVDLPAAIEAVLEGKSFTSAVS